MTVYITKTWGFGNPSGPLQFSRRGWRDHAAQLLKSGDLVAIVGTKNEPTDSEERGRVLGLMEPTTIPVRSLDYALEADDRDYDEQGNYRWPFGLELKRAWRFIEPRALFVDVTTRRFGMNAAQGIVALTDAESSALLALPREEVGLLQAIRAAASVVGANVARKRAAPPPTTTRRGVMHMRRYSAYTYAMRIIGADPPAFKIGWAFNANQRARQFNSSALSPLGGLEYKLEFTHLWRTATEAFAMEQSLLRGFDSRRHAANREVVAPLEESELRQAWVRYLSNVRP